VLVTVINVQHADSVRVAEDVVSKLEAAGVAVLYDDRDERPGVKFKDADLLGLPLRVNVGEKSLAKGVVEMKIRKSGEMRTVPVAQAADGILACVRELGG